MVFHLNDGVLGVDDPQEYHRIDLDGEIVVNFDKLFDQRQLDNEARSAESMKLTQAQDETSLPFLTYAEQSQETCEERDCMIALNL